MNTFKPPQVENIPPGFNSAFTDVGRACDAFLERRGLRVTREDYRQGHYAKIRAICRRRKLTND